MGFLDQLKKKPLPIDRGGTGAYTAADAKTNLGITAGASETVVAGGSPDGNSSPNTYWQPSGSNVSNYNNPTTGTAFIVPFDCIVSDFYFLADAVATGNNTLAVYKNGSVTALTVTLANGQSSGADLVNSFAAVAGDYLHIKSVSLDDVSEISWAFKLLKT